MGWRKIVRGVGPLEGVRRFYFGASRRWQIVIGAWVEVRSYVGSGCGGCPAFFFWDRRGRRPRRPGDAQHHINPASRMMPGGRRGRRPLRDIFCLWRCGEKKKGGIPSETPQHYHHTTLSNNCQLSVCEKLRILCFIPKFRKLFVWFPVLQKALTHGRLMVRKKVIPNMVSTPAGWAFKIFRFT